jgi:hypothetical protein
MKTALVHVSCIQNAQIRGETIAKVFGKVDTFWTYQLRRDLRLVGAAGSDWAALTVARGCSWRGSNGWLAAEASISTGMCMVSIGEREGEGEVQGARWLASGVKGLVLGGSSSRAIFARLPRAPLILCVRAQKDKGQRSKMKRGQREREGLIG